MSKYLKVPSGDYKIKVKEGGNIVLDTGLDTGRVIITGDLVVEGETTTVNTTNLLVEDNLIVLNKGETAAGISSDVSGIQIERGTLPDALMIFDEAVTWNVPTDVPDIGGTTAVGGFVFKNDQDQLVGIRTNSIDSDGGDLYLINRGLGVISVSGTINYEDRVTDPDHIPNKAYVDLAVNQIGDSIVVTGLGDFDTQLLVRDSERSEINDSFFRFNVDGEEVFLLNGSQINLHNLEIQEEEIRSTGVAKDIILTHTDTSSAVVINKTLAINPVTSSLFLPTTPTEGIKLYSDSESIGGTGLYFVNDNDTRDELVSRSRAILYGIIF